MNFVCPEGSVRLGEQVSMPACVQLWLVCAGGSRRQTANQCRRANEADSETVPTGKQCGLGSEFGKAVCIDTAT